MMNEVPNLTPTRSGLGGTLRLIGLFVLLLLASFAALVVLEVISQEQLAALGTKIGLLIAIVVATALGIAALMAGRR